MSATRDGPAGVEPAAVVALVADLFFGAKIRGAARAAGVAVRTTSRADDLVSGAVGGGVKLILVDLDARGQDAAATIARLKADPATAAVPVVAFGAHVDETAIRSARDAGADRVLARSGFVRVLPSLMRDAADAAGGPAGPAV